MSCAHIAAEVPVRPEAACRLFSATGYVEEAVLTDYAPAPWERSVETLTARNAGIAGLAVASDERIDAYILYVQGEIMALRSLVEDAGARL